MAKGMSPVPGIEFVRELGGIKEYLLKSNGLRILLVPDDSVPVAGVMVTYHVGSRNEATGYTGATHLLEHLMFKGSENFNHDKGTGMDRLLEAQGATINASTWCDYTNYYSVLPSSSINLPIQIEADRMRTARITRKDLNYEMPIVRNEYERGENLPARMLDEEMFAAAFKAHPYHHSTIGWKSDIEQVPVERLQQFYNDFYWPDNATLSIAGSFDENGALETVKKEFGRHPKAPRPFPTMYTVEPPQQGQRRVTIKRAGTNIMGIAHKIPGALHPDIPALTLLVEILAGDKTSRLYRAFIDSAKGTEAETYTYDFRDPSLLFTMITLATKTTHAEAEALVQKEYEAIKERGVTAAELARAKRSIRRQVANRRDGAYALLAYLNMDIAVGDWTRFVRLPEALAKVTAADIKRVAKTYLVEDQSTVGWFINTNA